MFPTNPNNAWSSPSPQETSDTPKILKIFVAITIVFAPLVALCIVCIGAISIRASQSMEAKREATQRREVAKREADFQQKQIREAELKARREEETRPPAEQKRIQDELKKKLAKSPRNRSIEETRKRFAESEAKSASMGNKSPETDSNSDEAIGVPIHSVLPMNVSLHFQTSKVPWGVTELAFSPDGKWLAAWKLDSTLAIFNVQTGKQADLTKELRAYEPKAKLKFAPDGRHLVAAHENGAVTIWSLSERGKVELVDTYTPHAACITSLDLSGDGNLIVTGSDDKSVQMYDRTKREVIWGNNDFRMNVTSVKFVEGTEELLVASIDAISKLSRRDGAVTRSVPIDLFRFPHSIRFTHDSTSLMISIDSTVKFVDVETGKTVDTVECRSVVWNAMMTPDGNKMVCGMSKGVVVWDKKNKQVKFIVPVDDLLHVGVFAISPDQKKLAAIRDSAGSTIKVFAISDW